jgi:hypothetical protein
VLLQQTPGRSKLNARYERSSLFRQSIEDRSKKFDNIFDQQELVGAEAEVDVVDKLLDDVVSLESHLHVRPFPAEYYLTVPRLSVQRRSA